jgi:hypothetical protein
MSSNLILAARLVAIFGILFLASFALDVFGSGLAIGDLIVALIIHLMPALIVAAFLGLAWRFPFAGGLIFVLFGIVPVVFIAAPFSDNLLLGMPFLVAGALFIGGAVTKR